MKGRKLQSSRKQDWAPFDTWWRNTVPWRNLPFWGAIFLAARHHCFVKPHVKCANAPSPKGQQTLICGEPRKIPGKIFKFMKNHQDPPTPLANDSALHTLSAVFPCLRLSRLCLSQGQVLLPYVENSLQSRLGWEDALGTRKRTLSPREGQSHKYRNHIETSFFWVSMLSLLLTHLYFLVLWSCLLKFRGIDRAFFGSQRASLRHEGQVRLKRPRLSRAETSVALTVLFSNRYGGENSQFRCISFIQIQIQKLACCTCFLICRLFCRIELNIMRTWVMLQCFFPQGLWHKAAEENLPRGITCFLEVLQDSDL